jgi:hypothetical protein
MRVVSGTANILNCEGMGVLQVMGKTDKES